MGTVAYMSPEQARGLRVDHRTDIFSFGVVLYEMLSGFPPFQRVTRRRHAQRHPARRTSGPPTDRPAIPALERIVRHCLEKKPEERFQNFRDLLFHLETRRRRRERRSGGRIGALAAGDPRRRRSRRSRGGGGIGACRRHAASSLRPRRRLIAFGR